MTIQTFRKKPVEIQAMQFTTNNEPSGSPVMDAIVNWCNTIPDRPELADIASHDGTCIFIETLEGRMCANVGDWIIRGVKGEFYPCKPDIFAATYDTSEPARGIDLELIEHCHDDKALDDVKRVGGIVPRAMRINGQDVLFPRDNMPKIHEIDFGDTDCAVVTLTLFARSVSIRAEK